MKELVLISVVVFIVLIVNPASMAGTVYIDDGLPHIFNDSTYQNDQVRLDYYTINNPGTHVDFVNGGAVEVFYAHNYASITMTGGTVGEDLLVSDYAHLAMSGGSIGHGLVAYYYASIAMTGGSIAGELDALGYATITMSGGSVGGWIIADEDSTITVSGGLVGSRLVANTRATIFLDGTDFEVNGYALAYGDRLSDFSNSGSITGTLADNTALDTDFDIFSSGADIIIIPEPATICLLGLGGLGLLRKPK